MYYNNKDILGIYKKVNNNLKFSCFADTNGSQYLVHHSLPGGTNSGGKLSLIHTVDSAVPATTTISAKSFAETYADTNVTMYGFMNSYLSPLPDFKVTNVTTDGQR